MAEQHGQAVMHQPVAEAAHSLKGVTTKKYFGIAIVLAIVTALEVSIFYIEALRPWLVPLLLFLSAIKFALVALYFMHLRFDKVLFALLLVAGLVMALGTFVAIGYIIG